MLKAIVAKNLVDLRKKAGMTQVDLAEQLNYSDKAVSKWERGDSLPDVAILKQIADLFGVTVDYLLQESHAEYEAARRRAKTEKRNNRRIIAALSAVVVWFVATLIFVFFHIFGDISFENLTDVFVHAIPVSMAVLLIFSCKWFSKKAILLFFSLTLWGLLISIYFTLTSTLLWFLLGIPAQIVILLVGALIRRPNEDEE